MSVLTLFIWYSIINLIVYLISVKLSLVLTAELKNSDCEFFHKLDKHYVCYIPFINTAICVVLLPLLIVLFRPSLTLGLKIKYKKKAKD